MGYRITQESGQQIWSLAERQHGVVSRRQLLDLGLTAPSIKHRVGSGRLHPVGRGVYALGRPQLTREGRWMAAVLSCGPEAALSHSSAAMLWELIPWRAGPVEVSVPVRLDRHRRGIVVHRRVALHVDDLARRDGIPATAPVCTLIDLATRLPRGPLEAAVNQADKLDLVDPETLRFELARRPHWRGTPALRGLLDRRTFALTDSELERRFLRLLGSTGLPRPRTGRIVNGFKVDFYWPMHGLIVETDGLRYHRTAAQQARDRARDQAHTAAGLTCLRFTHAQIRYEPEHVRRTLAAVARRLPPPGFCAVG